MNVFYAYSNTRPETKMTYDKVCETIEGKENKYGFTVIDVDNGNNNMIFDKMKQHIQNCDLFVCDITPDIVMENDTVLPNPNVMLELGYAQSLDKFFETNILFMINNKISKKVPSLLAGITYCEYSSDDIDYHKGIIEQIQQRLRNINQEYSCWMSIIYKLNHRFLYLIGQLLDVKMTGHSIRIHKDAKQMVILLFCNKGQSRILNVISKKLRLKKNEIDLSQFKEILDELNHLEMLAHLDFFR